MPFFHQPFDHICLPCLPPQPQGRGTLNGSGQILCSSVETGLGQPVPNYWAGWVHRKSLEILKSVYWKHVLGAPGKKLCSKALSKCLRWIIECLWEAPGENWGRWKWLFLCRWRSLKGSQSFILAAQEGKEVPPHPKPPSLRGEIDISSVKVSHPGYNHQLCRKLLSNAQSWIFHQREIRWMSGKGLNHRSGFQLWRSMKNRKNGGLVLCECECVCMWVWLWECVWMWESMCVCECVRVCECECKTVRVCEWVWVCVWECVRECESVWVYVCVYVRWCLTMHWGKGWGRGAEFKLPWRPEVAQPLSWS